jgi:hypothetical protein
MIRSAPRTLRVHSLRRLERRLDHTIALTENQTGSSTRRRELVDLSVELQRELARLEEMPWPSGRTVSFAGARRPLERRIVPLLRAVRNDPALLRAPRVG